MGVGRRLGCCLVERNMENDSVCVNVRKKGLRRSEPSLAHSEVNRYRDSSGPNY